jgi:phage terminase large subunit-like protein
VTGDGEYYFDETAADKPVRFIETFLRHYEGAFRGQPFILDPIQKRIVRDIFGWKCRETGFRRYTDVWLESAVGSGKSPLLAGLGLFGLMEDNEPGAQVFSVAETYQQALTVFKMAKAFIDGSDELAKRLIVHQREIIHPKSKSIWEVVTGKPKAGARPSMVLADEIHEWSKREVYDSLQGRTGKRRQPLFIGATNAGHSRQTLCWQLHEKALAAMRGTGEKSLYPVVWAAPDDADPSDPNAWKAANPLIGTTIREQKVRDEYLKSRGDLTLEARFRRLYLSHWVQGRTKWLDMTEWDARTAAFDSASLKDAVVFVGFDGSQVDDLTAAAFAFATPEKMYVDAHFWLPRSTAERYEVEGIPYKSAAAAGHITLVDEPTISPAVQRSIAAWIIERAKPHKIKAVCYDRKWADHCIAALESQGVTCVPIPQGYSVSPGCAELERRIKEDSIVISPNKVLRSCAEEVEVKYDDRSNFWPVKPNAKGKYSGTRSVKIDGITALVTAFVEARKHAFPRKKWTGSVVVV